MRNLLVVVFVTACAAQPPRSTINWPDKLDHTSTPATHREAALFVLDTSGMESAMKAMIDVSLTNQLQANPMLRQYEQVLRDFLSKYLSYSAIRDELAQAYMERFDELQLRQIAAFYQTPTGKIAIHKIPELMQVGAELGRKRVEAHQAELVEMLRKTPTEPQRQ